MKQQSKGSWFNRIAIYAFTALLGVFSYWSLSFLVSDIRYTKGPSWSLFQSQFIDKKDISQKELLVKKIMVLERDITNNQAKQAIIEKSVQSLQKTINQLIELKKMKLERSQVTTPKERVDLTASLEQFLKDQKLYQQLRK